MELYGICLNVLSDSNQSRKNNRWLIGIELQGLYTFQGSHWGGGGDRGFGHWTEGIFEKSGHWTNFEK